MCVFIITLKVQGQYTRRKITFDCVLVRIMVHFVRRICWDCFLHQHICSLVNMLQSFCHVNFTSHLTTSSWKMCHIFTLYLRIHLLHIHHQIYRNIYNGLAGCASMRLIIQALIIQVMENITDVCYLLSLKICDHWHCQCTTIKSSVKNHTWGTLVRFWDM